MPRQIALLRGINLGSANRISMPELREALTDAGFTGVQTYLQSGNIALSSGADPAALGAQIEQLLTERFGLQVSVVTRALAELETVVMRNPFPEAALQDPKRYQVTFLSEEPAAAVLQQVAALATVGERFAAHGRELYATHAAGIQNSKLANSLTPKRLGIRCATARNWTTVNALLEMASSGE